MEPPNKSQMWIDDFDAISTGAQDYLGDPAVVDSIVRKFLADAIERRDQWQKDGTGENPTEWLTKRIEVDGGKLLGKSNALLPEPDWNTGSQAILNSVRRRFDLKHDTPEKIIAIPFYYLVEEFLRAEKLAGDGQDWEHVIEAALELVVSTLIGTDAETHPFEE